MINLHDYVAVLIDADNVQTHLEEILNLSKYYGTLETCRAYGDWNQSPLKSHRDTFDRLGIDIIQVERGKNAADFGLTFEAGELLNNDMSRHYVGSVVIVSGDGHFTTACELIRQRGRKVIVIGPKEKTANSLKDPHNEFYELEALTKKLRKLKKRCPIPPDNVREFYDYFIFALPRLPRNSGVLSYDQWVSHDQIELNLLEKAPHFESAYRQYPLSVWLKGIEQDFESREGMVRQIDHDPEGTRKWLLYEAYRDTERDSRSHHEELGKALRTRDQNYESRFGDKTLSEWLADYPHMFRTLDNYVYLIKPGTVIG